MELDRRDFLKGAAATGILAASLGLAGCVTGAQEESEAESEEELVEEPLEESEETQAEEESEAHEDYASADIVVVGAGIAGLSCAVRAAQMGFDVALVEAADVIGGSAEQASGIAALHTRFHEQDPEADASTTAMMEKILRFNHWTTSEPILKNVLEQSSTNLAWLESLGFGFSGLASTPGSSAKTLVTFADGQAGLPGAGFVARWNELLEEFANRINLFTGYRATQTRADSSGKRFSVTVEKAPDGTRAQIDCRAVVCAAGGYLDSSTLMEELAGMPEGSYHADGSGWNTGEGIAMARSCGAQLSRFPGTVAWYGACLPGTSFGSELFCATSRQPFLLVNGEGLRFMNEEVLGTDSLRASNVILNQTKVFTIASQRQLDALVDEGCIVGCGELQAGSALNGAQTGLAMWAEYQQLMDAGSGNIYSGDTLEELAGATGIDEAALQATVDAYNGYCAAGVDDAFGKGADHLFALLPEDGPFYAFELVPGGFFTVGGLAVNEYARVLGESEPIDSMYAAGNDAGGIWGDSYDGNLCEGLQQCWAVYSGKLAAEHISETVFSTPCNDEFANPLA